MVVIEVATAAVLNCNVEVAIPLIAARAPLVIPGPTVGGVDPVIADVRGLLEVVLGDFRLDGLHNKN